MSDEKVKKKRAPLDPAKCKAPPWRPPTWTPEKVEALIDDLIEWAHEEGSISIKMWLAKRGLHYESIRNLRGKFQNFAEAHDLAKLLVGARREQMAMEGKISERIVMKYAPLYDPEAANWELKLRGINEAGEKQQSLNVYTRGPTGGFFPNLKDPEPSSCDTQE